MSTRLVCIGMDDTLATARELFQEFHFHHLLVLDGGRLAGVISDRDLLRSISPFIGSLSERDRDVATLKKRAHQIMTRHPITVAAEDTVMVAAQRMLTEHVSCLPVVAADGRVRGIVSWRDLLAAHLQVSAGEP